MNSPTLESPIALTEMELKPVRELLDEVRQQEQSEKLLFATSTWVNAFSMFKRARRRAGPPNGESATLVYGAVLGDLKTTGKFLLACVKENQFSLEPLKISQENFESAIRELSCDDVILELGLLNKDLSDVEAAFKSA
jgi:hypothetical protein